MCTNNLKGEDSKAGMMYIYIYIYEYVSGREVLVYIGGAIII